MQVNMEECKAAKLDPKKVAALAKKLSACGLEAQRMGLTVFGSGEGLEARDHLVNLGIGCHAG